MMHNNLEYYYNKPFELTNITIRREDGNEKIKRIIFKGEGHVSETRPYINYTGKFEITMDMKREINKIEKEIVNVLDIKEPFWPSKDLSQLLYIFQKYYNSFLFQAISQFLGELPELHAFDETGKYDDIVASVREVDEYFQERYTKWKLKGVPYEEL